MRLGDKIVLGVGLIVIIILLASCGTPRREFNERNLIDVFIKEGIITE